MDSLGDAWHAGSQSRDSVRLVRTAFMAAAGWQGHAEGSGGDRWRICVAGLSHGAICRSACSNTASDASTHSVSHAMARRLSRMLDIRFHEGSLA